MTDLHMHTIFSDGADSAEDMVLEAIRKGFCCIGFSDHSHLDWDECGMSRENTEAYRREIERLKVLYTGRIRILCGLERDYYSDDDLGYDFVIGSVHFIRMPDGYPICVDWDPDRLEKDVRRYFGGDWYAYAEAYYSLVEDVVRKTGCDIIGHFDLLTKFNEGNRYFDIRHPRYVHAWRKAADRLMETGKIFEVNTGALSRGYRTDPYPGTEIRAYLAAGGARMILSSDAHRKENIGFAFEKYEKEPGITEAGNVYSGNPEENR